MVARRLSLLLVAGSLAAAGCGGGDSGEAMFAPAAEPAVAPEPATEPAGDVIELGGEIEGLAFDPGTRTLAAVGRDPGVLNLVDAASFTIREQTDVGRGARHLQLAAPGGPVLVPAQFTDELWQVNPGSGRARSVVVGESPHDVAALEGRYFVGDEGGDTLTVVEGNRVEATLDAPVQPGSVEEVGGAIAVVAVAERVLTVYDPAVPEELATVPAGVGPTHAAALGERLFVADTEGDTVIEFRVSTGEAAPSEVGVLAIGDAPYGLAMDVNRERLWVSATGRNEVVAIELGEGGMELGASFPTVRQPNSVAVDEKTGDLYVASRTDGLLQRIDGKEIEGKVGDGRG